MPLIWPLAAKAAEDATARATQAIPAAHTNDLNLISTSNTRGAE